MKISARAASEALFVTSLQQAWKTGSLSCVYSCASEVLDVREMTHAAPCNFAGFNDGNKLPLCQITSLVIPNAVKGVFSSLGSMENSWSSRNHNSDLLLLWTPIQKDFFLTFEFAGSPPTYLLAGCPGFVRRFLPVTEFVGAPILLAVL